MAFARWLTVSVLSGVLACVLSTPASGQGPAASSSLRERPETAFPIGDADGDGSVTIGDVFYLINGLMAGGPAPIGSGDANGDNFVNATDIVYLINYLLAGGPQPTAPTGVLATIVGIQGSLSFSPDPLNANGGQTLMWSNADFATHRIVADDASFDTGFIAAGTNSAAIAAPAPGTYTYHCSLHPSMTGTVVVK